MKTDEKQQADCVEDESVALDGCPNCSAYGKFASAEGINTRALAQGSHAEGIDTEVSDEPEFGKSALGGHAEGSKTRATAWQAHAEGGLSWAEGLIAHAENCITLAAGNDSHAEGVQTVTGRRRFFILPGDQGTGGSDGLEKKPWFLIRANPALRPSGDYTGDFPCETLQIVHGAATRDSVKRDSIWARHNTAILFPVSEGPYPVKVRVLKTVFDPDAGTTKVFYDHDGEVFKKPDRIMMACASYAPEGDDVTFSDGKGQHAEGKRTNATGNFSHAEGRDTTCFGRYSHAEGYLTAVTGQFGAHGEGHATLASGNFSHAEGCGSESSGDAAHAEGFQAKASGACSHASGSETEAHGDSSFASGHKTCALHDGSFVVGRHGESDTPYAWHLAGGEPGKPELKARIGASGGYHSSKWVAGGQGYAERFEWADKNPEHEDRAGLFVTLQDEKIVKAGSSSSYVLGVVVREPGFLAGSNVFRERNPDFTHAPVALVGRVPVFDNSECVPGGFCYPQDNGRAGPAPEGFKVLRRIAADMIEIVLK